VIYLRVNLINQFSTWVRDGPHFSNVTEGVVLFG